MDNKLLVLAFGCFAFLLLFSSGCIGPVNPDNNATGNLTGNMTLTPLPGLKKFNSQSDLKAFLDSNQINQNYRYYDMLGTGIMPMMQTGTMMKATAEDSGSNSGSPDYSTTNIQVAGVDEADFVKSDGKYLYILSGTKLVIVEAYPAENGKILSEIEVGSNPSEIFVNNGVVVVFDSSVYNGDTTILQYDVTDRTNPILKKNVSVSGNYFSSRMVGNYVYAIINKPAYYYGDGPMPLPMVATSKKGNLTSFPDIYYFDEPAYSYSFTTIVSFDITSAKEEPEYKIFLNGGTENMYVSNENIYLTTQRVPDIEILKSNPVIGVVSSVLPMPPIESPSYQEETSIRRIAFQNGKVEYAAGGSVPGYILNQFSMDEHNGYFRIATTTGQVWSRGTSASKNHIYSLDSNLTIVGKLEDLAPGEKIYSARFMGDRAYLVTFQKIDPLFVIDLKNPKDPKVLGKLKIPGYSDYLHPYDETHLIGFGKDAIPSDQGDFSWYQGIKISLFDVSDVSRPIETANIKIGDRGSDSYALHDHKAFLFSKSRNLLVVPILEAKLDKSNYVGGGEAWQYGDFVYQGAYVFNISESNISLRGKITHLEDNDSLVKSGYYYYDSPYDVKRSMYINDVLYTVSDKKVKMNDLDDLLELKEVKLPYVVPEPIYYYGNI